MRTYYRKLEDVLHSPLAQSAYSPRGETAAGCRVLRSTRLEDAVYRDLRTGDEAQDALESANAQKLHTFPDLSRDVYQSFYSLNVRKNDPNTLSETVRRFNAPILEEVMNGEDYPAIKAACEGRQIPAYEAAGEFLSQISGSLDSLLEKASGKKEMLSTLERLEKRRGESMDALRPLLQQAKKQTLSPQQEQRLLRAANLAQSRADQVETVGAMAQNSLRANKEAVAAILAGASSAAAQKAQDAALVLAAWGSGPDNAGDPQKEKADAELVAKVQQSKTLLEVARHLGRLKELLSCCRKNSFAYGRGEKYSLKLGAELKWVLSSEYALLAMPEARPLFLRKLQQKTLKQYQRRDPIQKGGGDIICMLDESSSAADEAPWCKAVALALLDIAAQSGRRFAMVHFSGESHFQTDLFLPGQYQQADVYRAAETFLGGNTDYATPLSEALRLMEQDGFENADMVFVTDGFCSLPKPFLEKLTARQQSLRFHITGILLDQGNGGFEFSLKPFCSEIYRTSELAKEQIAGQLLTKRMI